MSKRPILTMEEDFQALGLISECAVDEMCGKDHSKDKKKPTKKGAMPGMENEDEDLGEMGDMAQPKGKKKKDLAKQLAAAKAKMSYGEGEGAEGFYDDDLDAGTDAGDDADLDEARRQKVKRKTGVAKIKAAKAGKISYRKHRSDIRRKAKTGKAVRQRRKREKFHKAHGPARKGYRTMINHVEHPGLANIAETLAALDGTNNIKSFQEAYATLWQAATDVAEGYTDLVESDVVSTKIDLPAMVEAAQYIAGEAMRFADAIADHDETVSASDRQVMEHHLNKLSESLGELDEMLECCEDTLWEMDNPGVDPNDDLEEGDEGLDEMAMMAGPPSFLWGGDGKFPSEGGVPAGGRGHEYGEHPQPPVHSHGNGPMDSTFRIMNPLGISRMGHREKLVLAKQLARETSEGGY